MNDFFRRVLPLEHKQSTRSESRTSRACQARDASGERNSDSRHYSRQLIGRRWPLLLATAVVSSIVLLLEITLTRFFSVFFNYHYVFVVLAVALLGLGLGATLCAATRKRGFQHSTQSQARALWQVCLGSGAILIVVIVLLTQTSLTHVLPAAAALALLPFLGAGLFLALVFTAEADHSCELYAADLIGAGIGALASFLALQWLDAETTLALAALGLLALAALLVLTTDPHCWRFPVFTCLLLGGLLGLKMTSGLLRINHTAFMRSHKHLAHILRADASARIVDSRWSALARTDVVEFFQQGQRQYAAFTDGGAATLLARLPDTATEWDRLDGELGLFPYLSLPRERVLIIGSGGGFDVLLALHGGAKAITAVEVNPDILKAVERFIPPPHNVYRMPTVEMVHGEGRRIVRQRPQVYDLIVLSQVYTGAAQRQGGALVENYALTTEAFQDYLEHLTPQGRLVLQVHDTAEVIKTVAMGLDALARRGTPSSEALQHILILQASPGKSDAPTPIDAPLVVLKNTPYTPPEGHQQASLAQTRHFMPLLIPHVPGASPLAELVTDPDVQLAVLGTILQPATDNRPFFYEMHINRRSFLWLWLIVLLILLGLHLWHAARQRDVESASMAPTTWLPFFTATGCAALLAQVALLQRYILVLGTPPVALATLLFPLLFFGGVGSLLSTLLSDRMLRRLLPWSCVALGFLLVLYLAAFPTLLSLLEQQALPVRVLSSMVVLAPLGLLMGLPFPLGLRLLSPMADTIVPWVWGVNSVACVLGSVAAVSLAVSWGLQAVVLSGAVVYVLAGYWARRLLAKQPQPVILNT